MLSRDLVVFAVFFCNGARKRACSVPLPLMPVDGAAKERLWAFLLAVILKLREVFDDSIAAVNFIFTACSTTITIESLQHATVVTSVEDNDDRGVLWQNTRVDVRLVVGSS